MLSSLHRSPGIMLRAAGFTIIELVVVIALLGILSTAAFSRFSDTQSYHDQQLRDQLISIARVAQQSALNRHGQQVTLQLSRPDDWLLEVMVEIEGTGLLSLKRQEVAASAARLFDPVGQEINDATPYEVQYDNLGNLASGAVSNLNFNDASAHVFCISLAGYAYQAADASDCANH
ncbi:MAG: MSHA pilin protein MshC [Motiliproteus sp.]|jgi:MSHA pilin protein MshC